ncbi:hypothetical protein OUZ56_005223 [Daphnia magna]|uniref:Uncharacterized protein n=1 Tax=Daphnia magna TaxID=35525 RepID=A0ABQ9YSD6_9CRUS|nr:hypothetical protein OUZ56_005223 [Daphnia magna]
MASLLVGKDGKLEKKQKKHPGSLCPNDSDTGRGRNVALTTDECIAAVPFSFLSESARCHLVSRFCGHNLAKSVVYRTEKEEQEKKKPNAF